MLKYLLTLLPVNLGDVSGDVTQWSDVANAVGEFTQTWADGIAEALPSLMDDPDSFSTWAGKGQFTGGVVDLSGLTNSLIQTDGTYMLSAAAQATGYIITRTA